MKVYAGDRTIDGIIVTADDEPLEDHSDTKQYTDGGFEWGYEGAAPSQLAYAILCDHLGDAAKAEALQERFMRAIVANFENEWELKSADIDRAIASL